MGKLIPILLALIGLAAGGGAGFFLRPPPAPPSEDQANCPEVPAAVAEAEELVEGEPTVEYVKLNNQFVVPIVSEARVKSLVIMSLSLEVNVGATEKVYASEPKLRDTFLQVLFDHANLGGFDGMFTSTANMERLRRSLLEAVRPILGDVVKSVLVADIVRQDTK